VCHKVVETWERVLDSLFRCHNIQRKGLKQIVIIFQNSRNAHFFDGTGGADPLLIFY
jgi:hypothetical protein